MKISRLLKYVTSLLVCTLIVVTTLIIIFVNKVHKNFSDAEHIALSLTINSGDGKVWATVKNDLTVFGATVVVIVQLYSSDTYVEDCTEMNIVCINSVADLNMGKTVSAKAETGGVEKFWLAKMKYKIDGGSWLSMQTEACRISASGDFLGYI